MLDQADAHSPYLAVFSEPQVLEREVALTPGRVAHRLRTPTPCPAIRMGQGRQGILEAPGPARSSPAARNGSNPPRRTRDRCRLRNGPRHLPRSRRRGREWACGWHRHIRRDDTRGTSRGRTPGGRTRQLRTDGRRVAGTGRRGVRRRTVFTGPDVCAGPSGRSQGDASRAEAGRAVLATGVRATVAGGPTSSRSSMPAFSPMSAPCSSPWAWGTASRGRAKRAGFAEVDALRLSTPLHYDSAEDTCGAAFVGGPVALAYSRFDEKTREEAHAECITSIRPYLKDGVYDIPGEFVVVRGDKS